jgi:hypothetical protein
MLLCVKAGVEDVPFFNEKGSAAYRFMMRT